MDTPDPDRNAIAATQRNPNGYQDRHADSNCHQHPDDYSVAHSADTHTSTDDDFYTVADTHTSTNIDFYAGAAH